jgi:DNA-binding PadR family transcriptional regulator
MFKQFHKHIQMTTHDHDHPGHSHGRFMRHGGGPFGGRGRFGAGWGGRARRGETKFLVLEVLAEGPRHGYEIIGAIEEKRGFRPSPGSIYPTLQMLEEGGFVTGAEQDGKRVYTIAAAGTELLANRTTDSGSDDEDGDDVRRQVKASAMKLGAALVGARDSDEATLVKIRGIVDRARREVYAILAADET